MSNILTAGSSFTLDDTYEFYAVYAHTTGTSSGAKDGASYVKVTSDLGTNWAGDYLIAYSDAVVADGRIGGKDNDGAIGKAETSVDLSAAVENDAISASIGDNYYVTLEEISEGSNTYVLKTQDGKYNYQSSNANGLAVSENKETAAAYPISVTFNDKDDIALGLGGNAEGAIFHYNTSAYMFRYYKNGTQSSVYLYKKQGGSTPVTTTTYYTRVFLNETASAPIDITGPSIIPSGYTLDMNGNALTNGYNATKLIIEDGGQLKTPSAVYATVEKNITGYGDANANTNKGYYLVSAPAEKYLYVALNNDDVDAYLFDASEQGAEWRNFKLATGAWNVSANSAVLYASKNDCTLSLDGYGIVYNQQGANPVYNKVPATNVDKSVDVVLNSGKTFEGWNLIGNPYTCTAYLAGGTQDFYRMNSTRDAIVLAASNERAIDVCEGIFVHCDAGGTVTFTTTDPTVTSTGNNNSMINLTVSQAQTTRGNASVIDAARIRFGEGQMLPKFYFMGNETGLCIPQDGKDYAVVRSEAHGEMPVNFKAAENGTYTISVETENLDVNYLHLIDNMTGMDVDLLVTPSYTFEGKKSDYASRFKLVFNADNAEMGDDFAFVSDGNVIILNEGEATLQVIDIMGRVISTQTVNGNASVNSVGAAGVYVLQLINGNNVKTQKIVVR